MELMILICSTTLHEEIVELFKAGKISSYSLLPVLHGSGDGGGTRFDNEVWPGTNQMYLLAMQPDKAAYIKDWAREYRKREVREGLKIFSLALKEII